MNQYLSDILNNDLEGGHVGSLSGGMKMYHKKPRRKNFPWRFGGGDAVDALSGGSLRGGKKGVRCVYGSKLQVWRGTHEKTAGGLMKGDLMENKRGKIVSKLKHDRGLQQIKVLRSLGYAGAAVRRSGRSKK